MASKLFKEIIKELPDHSVWLENNKITKQKLGLNYQLGFWVAKHIETLFPTISVEPYYNGHVNEISNEDKLQYEKLYNTWCNWKNDYEGYTKNTAWTEYRNYTNMLNLKYLPKIFEINLPVVHFTDEIEFRQGVYDCLWNNDHFSYNLENLNSFDIEFNEPYLFTTIKFKL